MFDPTATTAPSQDLTCHSGRDLAYRLRNRTASQRAVEAAELTNRRVLLKDLTATQLAKVFGISLRLLTTAQKLSPTERALVRRGVRKVGVSCPPLDKVVAKHGVESVWQALCARL